MLRAIVDQSFAGVAVGTVAIALAATLPASALTMKECSAKYQAERSAGTLKEKSWQDFRKAQCGPGASAAASPGTTEKAAPTPRAGAGGAALGAAVFPNAVSPKYGQESPGKARMHTCLDQYNANKASNGNAGLRWIQKGGGYYSECNRHLKG